MFGEKSDEGGAYLAVLRLSASFKPVGDVMAVGGAVKSGVEDVQIKVHGSQALVTYTLWTPQYQLLDINFCQK